MVALAAKSDGCLPCELESDERFSSRLGDIEHDWGMAVNEGSVVVAWYVATDEIKVLIIIGF